MGTVITKESKQRIESMISGRWRRAKPSVEGATRKSPNTRSGNFLTPTVLDDCPRTSQLDNTKSSAPVTQLVHANSIEEAMEFLRRSPTATRHRLYDEWFAARKFRYASARRKFGINLGWGAAPMALSPSVAGRKVFGIPGQGRTP